MNRTLLGLLVVVGLSLAACGVGMGGQYAADCQPGLRWNRPGQVQYQMPEPGPARLLLFDQSGRLVGRRSLRVGYEGSLSLSSMDLASGSYFAVLQRGQWYAASRGFVLR